jgi:DNA repair protein RadA/Sms
VFVCQACGSTQHRWVGKCPDCGQWDALEEATDLAGSTDANQSLSQAFGADVAPSAVPLGEVDGAQAIQRIPTGIAELDRVLGGSVPGVGQSGGQLGSKRGNQSGGLVPGSSVLIGGPPGIGKSTLSIQLAGSVAASGERVLYVSSEESAQQIALRARRLEIASSDNLLVLADTNMARIFEQIRQTNPRVIVLDSVQMIYKPDLDAAPGSVTQLRRCCAELVYLAKASGAAIILVGHVTKEGHLAGPKLLEHIVDAVLYFEGDHHHAHRIIRGFKNRYGATLEVGIFEMTAKGLRQAPEGSGVAAVQGGTSPRPGSVVCPVMTGSRCVLVELQALTATGFLGSAKRKASGIDTNRLAMLIAVLEQHAGLRLADRDIFASSVGGLRVTEPATDLALLLAIAGSHYKRALAPATAAVGEVGLGGEIRSVTNLDQRIQEAARLGYTRLIIPHAMPIKPPKGLTLVPTKDVAGAIEELG